MHDKFAGILCTQYMNLLGTQKAPARAGTDPGDGVLHLPLPRAWRRGRAGLDRGVIGWGVRCCEAGDRREPRQKG